jgi:predicted transcriptional regulator of viral defense system
VAVPRDSRIPSLDYPPIQAHRFSDEAYNAGIENHVIDGAHVKIYNPEKTLADCFKFRNKIGMEVVLEALKLYKSRQKFNLENLLTYGEVCRVKNIMTPYLEATI